MDVGIVVRPQLNAMVGGTSGGFSAARDNASTNRVGAEKEGEGTRCTKKGNPIASASAIACFSAPTTPFESTSVCGASRSALEVVALQLLLQSRVGLHASLSGRRCIVKHRRVARARVVSTAPLELKLGGIASTVVAVARVALLRKQAELPFASVEGGQRFGAGHRI